MLGKSFDEKEIEVLIQSKEQEFKKTINQKFQSSRDERIKFLTVEKAREIEKRIFLQSIDLNWKSHIQYL